MAEERVQTERVQAERARRERLLVDHVLGELLRLRIMAKAEALHRLNALLSDIRRAHETASLSGRTLTVREEAVLALGLVGIALDRRARRGSELNALWDSAIRRVRAWRDRLES